MARGRFITFEGIDGAGKSSHISACAQWLRAQRGVDVLLTREPGGTPLGEKLRELLLHQSMHLDTETLLMFAARREHLSQVIEPALQRGAWVMCDRFTDATYAYQGGGRGLSAQRIAVLEQWVHAQLQPDLTLLFDVDPQTAWERMQRAGKTPDRFEREQQQFFSRVREVYLARAQAFPARLRVVDATQTLTQVEAQLQRYLAGLA